MRKNNREINIFSLSAIDLFCSAMGAFMLISFVLMARVAIMSSTASPKPPTPTPPAPPIVIKLPPTPQKETPSIKIASLQLMIVLDTTSSMEPQISQLKVNISSLSLVLQKLSHQLKMGIVGYKDEICPEPFRVFPLTDIPQQRSGIVPAMQRLQTFTDRLTANAPNNRDWEESVELGIAQAVQQNWSNNLTPNDSDSKSIIILIGDAAAKPDKWNTCFSLISQWRNGHPDRFVYTVYIPNKPHDYLGNMDKQREFFQRIAQVGGGHFSENQGTILSEILDAIIK